MSLHNPHEVLAAARTLENILSSSGVSSFLVGSAACYLHGNARVPNDVDMVAFNTDIPEPRLQTMICEKDPNFFLVPSKNPLATYNVLWYRSSPSSEPIKTDVIPPRKDEIPFLVSHHDVLTKIQGITVLRLELILLLKLKAWVHHEKNVTPYSLERKEKNEKDLGRMLRVAFNEGVRFDGPFSRGVSIDGAILECAKGMTVTVERYCTVFPEMIDVCRGLGFNVSIVGTNMEGDLRMVAYYSSSTPYQEDFSFGTTPLSATATPFVPRAGY